MIYTKTTVCNAVCLSYTFCNAKLYKCLPGFFFKYSCLKYKSFCVLVCSFLPTIVLYKGSLQIFTELCCTTVLHCTALLFNVLHGIVPHFREVLYKTVPYSVHTLYVHLSEEALHNCAVMYSVHYVPVRKRLLHKCAVLYSVHYVPVRKRLFTEL